MTDEERLTEFGQSVPGETDPPHPDTSDAQSIPVQTVAIQSLQPEVRGLSAQDRSPQRLVSRQRLPAFTAAALLITLGVILVWPVLSGGFILVPAAIVAIVAGGLVINLLAYWLASGRKARGVLFLALLGTTEGTVLGLYVLRPDILDVGRGWPLFIAAVGLALLVTHILDRYSDRRVVLAAVVFLGAGAAGLVVTLGYIPTSLLEMARQGWPWMLIVLALGLLPAAFHRQPLDR